MSKNKSPAISVVMPVHNSADFLALAIESILKQTCANFEFIIIDDGSTDASWNIVHKYALKDKRIRARQNPTNLGICRTLNYGLSLAKGDYIARMDSDDWSYPDRLEKQLSFMKKHPKVIICGCNIEVCDRNLKAKSRRRYPTSDKKIREAMLRINPFAHPAIMYDRQMAIKAGGYNGKLFTVEDYDLYFRLGSLGQFANLSGTFLKLRTRRDSVSSVNIRRQTILNLYVRLKARVEYGYVWNLTDTLYFMAGLIGIIMIPARYRFMFYNFLRAKLK